MSGGDFSQPPFLQPLQQLANVPILPPVGAVGTPVETDAELLKNAGTTNGIRARKSFSLKEKIAHVTEFQKYIATEVNSRDNKTGKMKIWLKRKNDVEGVLIAYGTFYKWVQKYGTMIELNPSELSSLGNLKKLRRRPYEELELILVQYLKIRNENRQKKGKWGQSPKYKFLDDTVSTSYTNIDLCLYSIFSGLPLSTMAFIKEKAAMFHKDMYGEGDFKCSNGKF